MENKINLKALVDKGSNKIIFIESGNAFIDVLLSFLTIPLGTIIKLGREHSAPVEIGCMNNLYSSVEEIDVSELRSDACREMLLLPRNAAESHCKNLVLQIDHNAKPTRYFGCYSCLKRETTRKLFRYNLGGTACKACYCSVYGEITFSVDVASAFVKERARLLITDDLQLISPFRESISSLFTNLGVTNRNTTEELNLNIGVDEVVNLLIGSLVSKTPLTETLLKHKPVAKLTNENNYQAIHIDPQTVGETVLTEEDNISIKLIISKSKNIVCYAEAGEDFVNLLFSFLTLPLGFVAKQIQDGSLKGCIDHLYRSVQDLDAQYLNSNHHKEMLVNPKLVPDFCYNSLLGIEEASYYYLNSRLTTDCSLIPSNSSSESFKIEPTNLVSSAGGFLKGPAFFTVTDNLVIRPISTILELSVLDKLNVPVTDTEKRVVLMGKKEALSLLVASFDSDSALTNAFISKPYQA
ncbi:hypothetical protein D8674_006750 [Pyrus ussuriensis x Pyrus communis]|uniref:DUF674 domain-containing protein n=1 Tax=Pyrus ussuriensis x Pyrus communis TaxID=2448454 RepID=A0A5N5FVE0_9ROSA|nr:hypothetical protein D8674_006750 [Pyrus ussuriensis x Pyrus communis]